MINKVLTFLMAWRDDPLRSFRSTIALEIMYLYGAELELDGFLTAEVEAGFLTDAGLAAGAFLMAFTGIFLSV